MVGISRIFGALSIGASLVIRGLDFIVHANHYPPFFREHMPAWDRAAHKATPITMRLWGIVLVVFGTVLMCVGVVDVLR